MNIKISMKRRLHGIITLTLALALIVFTAACSKNSNTGNSSNSTSSTTKPAGSMSPTDSLKAYWDAARRKDIETVKKYLSRGSIQAMEDMAKITGKTFDELMRATADEAARSAQTMPEFSNERVSGDTATVDFKPQGQPLQTMEMVKEDGTWKLAVDKMMQKAMPAPPAPDMDNDNDHENH